MRKILKSVALLLVLSVVAHGALAGNACNTIQSGTITDAKGNLVRLGFDQYGYNYQAHLFNGLYDNYSRPDVPVMVGDIMLLMKWSDTWLSNQDCNNDGKLDRGWGTDTPGTSQGWLTNQMEGDYQGSDLQMHHFTYFVKIVYMPTGCESGKDIWGPYCIIEELQNDPFGEQGGKFRSKIIPPGFGLYTN